MGFWANISTFWKLRSLIKRFKKGERLMPDETNGVKPGIKTSEFYVTIAGVGAILGLGTPEQLTELAAAIVVAVKAISAAAVMIGYTWARFKSKQPAGK